MANNTKLILQFFSLFVSLARSRLLSLLLSVHSFVRYFLRCFCRSCSLRSSLFVLRFLARHFIIYYSGVTWRAIRPRMSRIIYMSFTLHCFFFVGLFEFCHAFFARYKLIAVESRMLHTHTHSAQKCCCGLKAFLFQRCGFNFSSNNSIEK